MMATVFAGHPYANDPDGTPDDLKTLTPQTSSSGPPSC